VTGTVNDESGMPLPGANVIVMGTSSGAISDFDGKFTLSVSQAPPFTVQISSVGFTTATEEVTANNQDLSITLTEGSFLDEVVVTASRVPQRIFESPVTVEKYSLKQIQRTPSADFFEGLQNVKGVQMNQTGLVFSQVNTRGFGTAYNEGFVTMVDGMNTQAPVFGFAVGNLIGLNELDVESVELLPGSASALYGMDAYKGIMSIKSKNPFEHEGINAYFRSGTTQQEVGGNNAFTDFGFRAAKKLSDKWAVKVAFSAKEGTEWAAGDRRQKRECANCGEGSIDESYDIDNPGPDYDAVNEYGQNTFNSSQQLELLSGLAPALGDLLDPNSINPFTGQPIGDEIVSNASNYFDTVVTTGYTEQELFGNDASNVKGNAGIYFRPNDNTEISLSTLIGTGEAPLPAGNARYNLKDVVVQLHKLEVQSGGLTARLFYTKEDAGSTTQSTALGNSVAAAQGLFSPTGTGLEPYFDPTNEDHWNGIQNGWGQIYISQYLGNAAAFGGFGGDVGALLQNVAGHIYSGGTSFNDMINFTSGQPSFPNGTSAYHQTARETANLNMLVPGEADFVAAVNAATNGAILTISDQGADRPTLGALIKDVSTVATFEANYDFEDKISFANVIVGGLYRGFSLDTDGTLYTDYGDPIEYNEYGVFAQMQKDLFNDDVSLTASMRYDKQSVMEDANVTPRLGLLFKLSEKSNIRVAAQLGFRNPTNQDKFIGLYNGSELLLGTTKENIDRFSQSLGGTNAFGGANGTNELIWTGDWVFNNAYNKSAFDRDESLVSEELDYVEAEKVTTYDIGYRYNSKNFTLDINAYYSQYENYIGTNSVYVAAEQIVELLMTPAGGGLTEGQAIASAMGAAKLQFGMDANLDVPFDTFGVALEAIQRLSASTNMNFIYEYNELDYTAKADSNFELSWNTPKHRMKFGFTTKLGDGATLSANARYNSEYYYESSFIDATIRENTVFDAKLMFGIKALDNLQFEVGGNNIAGREYVSIPGSGNIGSLYYAGAKMQF
jgi:outer membrane receptor protein involved in Fe transport